MQEKTLPRVKLCFYQWPIFHFPCGLLQKQKKKETYQDEELGQGGHIVQQALREELKCLVISWGGFSARLVKYWTNQRGMDEVLPVSGQ